MDATAWEGWAIVELMGHTRYAGRCLQASMAGLPAMRVDMFAGDDEAPFMTKLFPNANAFYAVTPTDEAICRLAGAQIKAAEPPQVYQYQLTTRVDGVIDDDEY